MTAAVAVVVPVHDGAATIAETVASALAQTAHDLELVVVDDGSTDRTREVLAAIADPRLRVVSQPRRGVAAARNRGAAETRAPLLAFLDADDLWLPGKLAGQRTALAGRPGATVAYSWTDYVDEEGRRLGPDRRATHEGDVLAPLLVRDFLESASNALVRRQAFEAVGGFDETLAGAADWDLLLRLAERHPFACAPEVGVRYRIGGGSMSAAVAAQEAECRRVLDAAFARAAGRFGAAELRRLRRRSRAELGVYLASRSLAGGRRGRAAGYLARAAVAHPPTVAEAVGRRVGRGGRGSGS